MLIASSKVLKRLSTIESIFILFLVLSEFVLDIDLILTRDFLILFSLSLR